MKPRPQKGIALLVPAAACTLPMPVNKEARFTPPLPRFVHRRFCWLKPAMNWLANRPDICQGGRMGEDQNTTKKLGTLAGGAASSSLAGMTGARSNAETGAAANFPAASRTFHFTDHNGSAGWCDLSLSHCRDGRTIAIVTECADNPGMSVTNAADCIAWAILLELHLQTQRLILIEHYDRRSYRAGLQAETFDLVTFGVVRDHLPFFANPSWQRLPCRTLAEVHLDVVQDRDWVRVAASVGGPRHRQVNQTLTMELEM